MLQKPGFLFTNHKRDISHFASFSRRRFPVVPSQLPETELSCDPSATCRGSRGAQAVATFSGSFSRYWNEIFNIFFQYIFSQTTIGPQTLFAGTYRLHRW